MNASNGGSDRDDDDDDDEVNFKSESGVDDGDGLARPGQTSQTDNWQTIV